MPVAGAWCTGIEPSFGVQTLLDDEVLVFLPRHAVRWVGHDVVEAISGEAVLRERVALAGFFVSWMKSRALSKKIIALEDFFNSDETEYYVECPKCGNKIILNKVKILYEKQKEANK